MVDEIAESAPVEVNVANAPFSITLDEPIEVTLDEPIAVTVGAWVGTVYSAKKTVSGTTVTRWVATETRLTKVSIVNTNASNSVAIGAYNSNVATFRASAYTLAPYWGVHLYDVNMYTLGYATIVDNYNAALNAIGVEE